MLKTAHFDGDTYEAEFDYERLTGQNRRVYDVVAGGDWLTLDEISQITGDPQASVSARLRDLRKDKFGAATIERNYRGDRAQGLYEYRMVQ